MRTILMAVSAAIAVVTLVLGVATMASPYRVHSEGDRPRLATSTDVDAPCDSVFDYLGNSSNASSWSVYVDHITPLNAASVRDGSVGSIRRSFKNADETGMRWDEYFTDVVPGERRELRIYNIVDAPATAEGTFLTQQLYTPLGSDRCRLTFTLFFAEPPSATDWLKMRIKSHEIGGIFEKNLANIGRLAARSNAGPTHGAQANR